jgi:hypothetical protein
MSVRSPVLVGAAPRRPIAELDIAPPPTIDSAPASTTTPPALLVLPASAYELIPVRTFWLKPAPSIVSWPETVTEKSPPLPEPKVAVEIMAAVVGL